MRDRSTPLAVIDGVGEHADVRLYIEWDDGERLCELPWPSDWPAQVTPGFLRAHGFEVRNA